MLRTGFGNRRLFGVILHCYIRVMNLFWYAVYTFFLLRSVSRIYTKNKENTFLGCERMPLIEFKKNMLIAISLLYILYNII